MEWEVMKERTDQTGDDRDNDGSEGLLMPAMGAFSGQEIGFEGIRLFTFITYGLKPVRGGQDVCQVIDQDSDQ
jgi:hypothetical protein